MICLYWIKDMIPVPAIIDSLVQNLNSYSNEKETFRFWS